MRILGSAVSIGTEAGAAQAKKNEELRISN
jgi:hypothetical protein